MNNRSKYHVQNLFNLHRQRILTKEGSILINGNNNIITKEPEANINNNTIPILHSKPSISIQTHRKYPIEPTTRLPGCNGPQDVTQNNNQPHQECVNPYLSSISSLTIKNTPIATPPNQATNQKITSTDPHKNYPHPLKMILSNADLPQISTKICNHNHHQISSSHSFSTRKN